MGGDFFHIARLSDDTAGVCICDVMGHGVRAALITAMLRALIETHAVDAADPGRFLTELNNEFTRIMKQTGTLVFATVLYCVINIRERGARFAPGRSSCAVACAPNRRRSPNGGLWRRFQRACDGPDSQRTV